MNETAYVALKRLTFGRPGGGQLVVAYGQPVPAEAWALCTAAQVAKIRDPHARCVVEARADA